MREEIKETTFYEVAKKSLKNFLSTLQREILPITFSWHEAEKKVYTNIGWNDPEMYDDDDMNGFYGKNAGLYIKADAGDYHIYLPKTSEKYAVFHTIMTQLCELDDEIIEDSVPDEIMIFFDGDSTVNFKLAKYIFDVTSQVQMKSAKVVSNMLLEMISDYELCEGLQFYEGDDEPDVDGKECVYHPGDEIPSNYFVGVSGSYDFFKVR